MPNTINNKSVSAKETDSYSEAKEREDLINVLFDDQSIAASHEQLNQKHGRHANPQPNRKNIKPTNHSLSQLSIKNNKNYRRKLVQSVETNSSICRASLLKSQTGNDTKPISEKS